MSGSVDPATEQERVSPLEPRLEPPLLDVTNLTVEIGTTPVLRGVDITVHTGETLAIVGESGCGKSMTAMSIMGLLPKAARVSAGAIRFDGNDLTCLDEPAMRKIRGNRISIIFQEPTTSLNPLMTVRKQLIEAIVAHQPVPAGQADARAEDMLRLVGIPDPRARLDQYAFELSGGMCQRVMIAIALACRPAILIADEPTTALDVTIQAQILDLIRDLRDRNQTAVILITHDLGVVADMADRVAVMYGGAIVEEGDVHDILQRPRHPYTKLLMTTIPRLDGEIKSTLKVIEGMVPDAHNWPTGCLFHPRCPLATDQCRADAPGLEPAGDADHNASCWRKDDVDTLGTLL